jgi:hypothetical protein
MGTEEDLRRCARAAVSLASSTARRARDAAERVAAGGDGTAQHLLAYGEQALTTGREAAADAVGVLRRDVGALLAGVAELDRRQREAQAGGPRRGSTGRH